MRDEDRPVGAEHVAFFGMPVSCAIGVSDDGLEEAAVNVARWVQAELHAQGDHPLDERDALDLGMLRLRYVNALYWRGGHVKWKEVEFRVAPQGQPLAICSGSSEPVPVQASYFGQSVIEMMHGYRGCLRTFPINRHGRGRPWPTWCPECRPAKTNAKRRAITAFQKRIAEIGR